MEAGTKIGHYKIIRPLGKGGMGEVYLAEDTTLKRRVALKVLPEEVRHSPERLARFRTEAEAAAKLNHPNIATIHSIEETDDQLYITMEYVDGQPLNVLIPSDGLTIDQFFEWFIPLIDGLAHAHEERVIHRDLKPGNIMVSHRGAPKILDFGLARITQPAPPSVDSQAPTSTAYPDQISTQTMEPAQGLTSYGQVMGTLSYMSPEQAQGQNVDRRSDIFSIGVLMYEALTGQMPFTGDTRLEIVSKILQADPPSVTDTNPVVPDALGQLITRCLAKAPADRYQNLSELHTDLTAMQAQQLPAPAKADPSRWSTVLRWSAVAVMLTVLGLVLGIWTPFVEEMEVVASIPEKPSIAVMYFSPLSSDQESQFLAAGMTDGVITGLAKLGKMDVRSRGQVVPYRDQALSFAEVREQLDVDVYLEASLQIMGNSVRVNAQLVDASTGNMLWANQFDRAPEALIQVQDEIAQTIATTLRIDLGTIQQNILTAQPTQDARAFEWASQGIYYFDREIYNLALTAFDSALVIDPMYAIAHYNKGRTYQALERYGEAMSSYQRALPRTEQFRRTLWEWRDPEPGEENRPYISWRFAPDAPIAIGLKTNEARTHGEIIAIDWSRQTVLWTQDVQTTNLYSGSTIIRDGNLYVTSADLSRPGEQSNRTEVLAYNIETGRSLFSRTLPYENLDQRVSPWLVSVLDERLVDAGPINHNFPLLVANGQRNQTLLYALDPRDGTIRWSFQSRESAIQQPVLVTGRTGETHLLIRGDANWTLLNMADGAVVWDMTRAEKQQLYINQGYLISLFEDSTAITGQQISDLEPAWTYQTDVPIKQAVNLSQNGLLTLQLDGGKLIALDTGSRLFDFGRVQWEAELGEDTYTFRYDTDDVTSAIWTAGVDRRRRFLVSGQLATRLYATSSAGVITAIDLQSGTILGQTATGMDNVALKLVDSAVIGTAAGYIFRLDNQGRTLLWRTPVQDPGVGHYPISLTRDKLIVGKNNLLSAYDLEFGELLWNYAHNTGILYIDQAGQPDQLIASFGHRQSILNLQESPAERLLQEKTVLVNLAQCAVELAQYPAAENYLNTVVRTLDPGYAEAYLALADLYEMNNQKSESIQALIHYHGLFPAASPETRKTEGRLENMGSLVWHARVRDAGPALVVNQDYVFSDGRSSGSVGDALLSALNRETGEPVWSNTYFRRVEIVQDAQASDTDDLFILTQGQDDLSQQTIASVQKANGETNWQTRILQPSEGQVRFSATHYRQHLLLAGRNIDSQSDFLMVYNTTNGTLDWEISWPVYSTSRAFYESTLAIAFKDSIQFRDIRSGAPLWTYDSDDTQLTGQIRMLTDEGRTTDRLAFTTTDNRYHALDLNTRALRWSFLSPIGARGYSAGFKSLYSDYSENMMIDWHGPGRGQITAFAPDLQSPGQGRVIWDIPLEGFFGIVYDDGPYLFVQTLNDPKPYTLLKINKSSGVIEAEYPLLWNGWVRALRDNIAYVSARPHIYAIQLD